MTNRSLSPLLPGPAPAPRPALQGAALSRRAKAAIVVQFLLQEGADVPLSTLPRDLQVELTRQLGAMRYVDRATLRAVMEEFANDLDDIGLRFPGGIAGALNALEGRLDPAMARRLRRETGARRGGDPWARIAALEPERLVGFAQAESVEVAAVLISKLDVAKAAELLGLLPGDRARRIAYAVSMTANVTPDAVDRIGQSLVAQLDEEPARAFDQPPVARVGEILNFAPTLTREDVLTGLDETDKAFAEAVRKAIFTFADMPARLDPRDVPKITRDVDQAVIVTALAGAGAGTEAEATAAQFLLDNLSKRMAQALREEAADRGDVPLREAEAPMGKIVAAIRDMSASGEIKLRKPGEAGDGG